jgi:hypothetical protein
MTRGVLPSSSRSSGYARWSTLSEFAWLQCKQDKKESEFAEKTSLSVFTPCAQQGRPHRRPQRTSGEGWTKKKWPSWRIRPRSNARPNDNASSRSMLSFSATESASQRWTSRVADPRRQSDLL